MLLSAPLFFILSDIAHGLLWCNADCHVNLVNTFILCLSRLMLKQFGIYSHQKKNRFLGAKAIKLRYVNMNSKVSVHAEAQQGQNLATYDRGRRRVGCIIWRDRHQSRWWHLWPDRGWSTTVRGDCWTTEIFQEALSNIALDGTRKDD